MNGVIVYEPCNQSRVLYEYYYRELRCGNKIPEDHSSFPMAGKAWQSYHASYSFKGWVNTPRYQKWFALMTMLPHNTYVLARMAQS